MTSPSDDARLAEIARLTANQQLVLGRMDERWRPASDAISLHMQSPGIVCSTLVGKGFLERRSDPDVWGRSQYRRPPPKGPTP